MKQLHTLAIWLKYRGIGHERPTTIVVLYPFAMLVAILVSLAVGHSTQNKSNIRFQQEVIRCEQQAETSQVWYRHARSLRRELRFAEAELAEAERMLARYGDKNLVIVFPGELTTGEPK